MTTAGSTVAPLRTTDVRRRRHTRVFRNLLFKELRESSGTLVAGLAIYWLMPAILELVYVAIDPRHEVITGFAWFFILSTGWFFSVVVGAHTVCRDWGKAEEHFLLAQPVTPRTVIWAKLVAGISVVATVSVVACLWDLSLGVFSQTNQFGTVHLYEVWRWIWVFGCTLTISFVMAFAAAVMLRQMLPSVLLPVLVIIIWSIVPLISGRLAFLRPPWVMEQNLAPSSVASLPDWIGLLADIWTAITVGACIIISLGMAFLTCTRERVIRLGHKPLAWATALTVILIFLAAMDEVGNSLSVRDQYSFATPTHADNWSASKMLATASYDDRFFTLCHYDNYSNYAKMAVSPDGSFYLREFHVDEGGRIRDSRQVDLKHWAAREYKAGRLRSLLPDLSWWQLKSGLAVARDSPAHIILSWRTREAAAFRLILHWPDDRQPELVSEMTTSLPKMGEQPVLMTQLTTSRFSYFLYSRWESKDPITNRAVPYRIERGQILVVVDWADETNAHVRYSIQLPSYTVIGLKQECLVFARHLYGDDWDIDVVPVDNPDVLAELQDHPNKLFRPDPNAWWRAIQPLRLSELQRLGQTNPTAWAMGKNDILYVSDMLGLRAFDLDEFGIRRVIGECRRSPLSMLLNDYRQSFQSPLFQYLAENPVQLLGDSLLIEPGLAAYDVSDPARPRRTGFFNITPEARILAAPHHLVVCESSLVTVVDRPGR